MRPINADALFDFFFFFLTEQLVKEKDVYLHIFDLEKRFEN